MASYKDLIVWQKAVDLADAVYDVVKKLPKEETYALSDQMRRSAVSVPSNIAEGQGRASAEEFKRFLNIAKGSANELQTQLIICRRRGFISEEEFEKLDLLCDEVSKMIKKLKESL